ncbi:hypothetical protein OQA88_8249 [Cercophora sp. LCS_1]
MSSAFGQHQLSGIDALDAEHSNALRTALSRILSAEVTELAFAELLDGLPATASFREFHGNYQGSSHPAFLLNHTELCPGVIERVRSARDKLDLATLNFAPDLLSAFQRSPVGTQRFELRLMEILAVACHNIAVYLWNLDDGIHKHQVYEDWRDKPGQELLGRLIVYRGHTPFYHNNYQDFDQYPNGLADLVGYWAEARIFGGVILFDRGESGTEVRLSLDSPLE